MPRKSAKLAPLPFPKIDQEQIDKENQWRSDLESMTKEELIELAICGARWSERLWKIARDQSIKNQQTSEARKRPGFARHAATNEIKQKMKVVWESDEWRLRRERKDRGVVKDFANWVIDWVEENCRAVTIDAEAVGNWTRDWRKPVIATQYVENLPPTNIFRLLMYFPKF